LNTIFVKKSEIKNVAVYRNAAIVRRKFFVELEEGENEIKLMNIENTVIPASIRVFASKGVKVRNVDFSVIKKPVEEIDIETKRKLLDELGKLEVQKEILENEIDGIKQVINAIDSSMDRIIMSFGKRAVMGEAVEENLSKTLKYLTETRKENLKQLVEKEKQLREVNSQIEQIRSLLTPEEKRRLKEVGVLTLTTSATARTNYVFEVEYNVAKVSWMPTYDLILRDNEVTLVMYAKILQKTTIPWENVSLTVSTKTIQPVSKPEPQPWYIERMKMVKAARPVRTLIPAIAAPRVAKMKAEVEEELAFEEAAVIEGEFLTFEIKEPISLYPNKPQLALLTSHKINVKTKYVWYAFRQPGFIEIVEFENPELTISPGECRIFRGDLFVGVTNLPYTAPGQKVEFATMWDENIETKRKLVQREEKKKGVLRDKAYVKYTYRLTIINHKKTPIDAEIIDQIPVAKDPEIEVTLEKVSVEPVENNMGILKWKFEVKLGEKREIEYTFTVKFPPEYEIANLP